MRSIVIVCALVATAALCAAALAPDGIIDASNIGQAFAELAPLPPSASTPAATADIIDSSNIAEAFATLSPDDSDLPAANATTMEALRKWRLSVGMPLTGRYGVDVSQAYDESTFKCLKSHGFSFVIPRIWQSLCQVDPNGARTVDAAWRGGMKDVDVYFFPAFKCPKSPEDQVRDTINALKGHKFGKLWFDIETSGSNWGSHADNQKWLKRAVDEAKKALGAKRVGIYTNANSWNVVMGGVREFGAYELWWPYYDGEPSFAHWANFGDWHKPVIKQFNDAPSVCGASIDHNWRP